MKKFLGFISFILILLLASCNVFSDNDSKLANFKATEIVEAIESRQRDKIKSLFSLTVSCDFNESINELFQYYKEEHLNIEHSGGPNVSDSFSQGNTEKMIRASYKIITEENVYSMSFTWCSEDDFNPQNIGLRSLYLIKDIDNPHYSKYVYWGDGTGAEGIFVNKPHASSYLETMMDYISIDNKERFKFSFSKSTLDSQIELDNNVDILFSAFDGIYDYSNNRVQSFSLENARGYDISYYAVRDKGKVSEIHCFCLRWCVEAKNSNDLGALSFYYKKADESLSMEEPYWADGLWTPGIHVGVHQNPTLE